MEANQKTFAFHHDKDIDILKLGCTLPNLANICPQISTDANFYPFTEGDKDQLEKIREDVVGGPSIVLTRKAAVDETFIICKSSVGSDASTGFYTRWDVGS